MAGWNGCSKTLEGRPLCDTKGIKMGLDYEGLMRLSKDKAKEECGFLLPPDCSKEIKDDLEFRITMQKYYEYITP